MTAHRKAQPKKPLKKDRAEERRQQRAGETDSVFRKPPRSYNRSCGSGNAEKVNGRNRIIRFLLFFFTENTLACTLRKSGNRKAGLLKSGSSVILRFWFLLQLFPASLFL